MYSIYINVSTYSLGRVGKQADSFNPGRDGPFGVTVTVGGDKIGVCLRRGRGGEGVAVVGRLHLDAPVLAHRQHGI